MFDSLVQTAGVVLGTIVVGATAVLMIQFINNASRNMSSSNAGVSDRIGDMFKSKQQ